MRCYDLIELLDDAELPLPPPSAGFRALMQSKFDAYLDAVRLLQSGDYASATVRSHAADIERLAKQLLEVLDHWHADKVSEAASALSRALALVDPWLTDLESLPLNDSTLQPSYRIVSRGRSATPVRRGDLFHIPFEKRSLASPSRYSIQGRPSLYLGRSIYVCWEELGRPAVEDCWVAAIGVRSGEVVRVLNLGYRPALMAAMLNSHGLTPTTTRAGALAVAYACVWPLIAVCSTRRAGAVGPRLVPCEYVVPQLLMRWLTTTKAFLGIRYFTTKVLRYDLALSGQNYVFPTLADAPSGYCSVLSSKFAISDAVPLLDAMNAASKVHDRFRDDIVETPDGRFVLYGSSPYARAEAYLDSLDRGPP